MTPRNQGNATFTIVKCGITEGRGRGWNIMYKWGGPPPWQLKALSASHPLGLGNGVELEGCRCPWRRSCCWQRSLCTWSSSTYVIDTMPLAMSELAPPHDYVDLAEELQRRGLQVQTRVYDANIRRELNRSTQSKSLLGLKFGYFLSFLSSIDNLKVLLAPLSPESWLHCLIANITNLIVKCWLIADMTHLTVKCWLKVKYDQINSKILYWLN